MLNTYTVVKCPKCGNIRFIIGYPKRWKCLACNKTSLYRKSLQYGSYGDIMVAVKRVQEVKWYLANKDL